MKLRNDVAARCGAIWDEASLGDPRRTRRAVITATRMARKPSSPLPAALGTDAAVQGAYRFVNNAAVDFQTLVSVLSEATRLRVREECTDVLVLHDTTDCSFPHLESEEIGVLNTGKAGFRLHLSLVADANGWRRPLGVIAAETIHRAKPRTPRGRAGGPETAKWKDKEFERWQRGIEVSQERLAGCPSVIHVADRESDSYGLMQATLAAGGRFVFRVRVDRRRSRAPGSEAGFIPLTQLARGLNGLLERDVPLSARKDSTAPAKRRTHPPRHSRIARLRFSATQVELPRPPYLRDPIPRTLVVNLVHVLEVDAPDGEKPVEWLLYTTEPVETGRQVERIVDIYRTRWLSEEFHAALKGGCAFESREFESRHALLNILALTLPIACEVLALRSGARTTEPHLAIDVLSLDQLRILRTIGHYPLGDSPTASEALLALAALGGHLKRNGPPGWKVLSRGMTELLSYEAAEARRHGGGDL
jgi:hypothetical protein